jgi:hypothetical protein
MMINHRAQKSECGRTSMVTHRTLKHWFIAFIALYDANIRLQRLGAGESQGDAGGGDGTRASHEKGGGELLVRLSFSVIVVGKLLCVFQIRSACRCRRVPPALLLPSTSMLIWFYKLL